MKNLRAFLSQIFNKTNLFLALLFLDKLYNYYQEVCFSKLFPGRQNLLIHQTMIQFRLLIYFILCSLGNVLNYLILYFIEYNLRATQKVQVLWQSGLFLEVCDQVLLINDKSVNTCERRLELETIIIGQFLNIQHHKLLHFHSHLALHFEMLRKLYRYNKIHFL